MDPRMQFMFASSSRCIGPAHAVNVTTELATAARKDQVSKSLNNLGGPHAAQRISIRTKCEKTKQYIQYRTRVSASKRVLLTQDRGI